MSILCLVYISYLLFFLSFSNFVKYENGYGVANVRIVQVIKKPSFVFNYTVEVLGLSRHLEPSKACSQCQWVRPTRVRSL